MIADPRRKSKNEPIYLGPYRIIRRTPNGSFMLRDAEGETLDRLVPSSDLKLVSKTQPPALYDDVYEVQSIRGHRVRHGKDEYLIRWRGWSEDTWEPVDNVHDNKLIADFNRRRAQEKKKQRKQQSTQAH